jgi:ribosomal protein L7/L12
MIRGIKAYRAATGSGLKESKYWCEKFRQPRVPIGFDDARMQRLEDRVFNLERRYVVNEQ